MPDDTKSRKLPIGKRYTIVTGEASSGIAHISIVSNPNRNDDAIYTITVKDSNGKDKTNGLRHNYISASGVITIEDSDTNLVANDSVNAIVMHYV